MFETLNAVYLYVFSNYRPFKTATKLPTWPILEVFFCLY